MNDNPTNPSAPEGALTVSPAGENTAADPAHLSRDVVELLHAIFEQAAVGVAQVETATGRFVRINQRYCNIVGYTGEEMEKLDFQTITHPDDLPADINNMRRLVDGQIRGFTREKRYYRKDGSIVWVNLTVSPLWQPGEPPSFTIAMVEDITEHKRAEEALRESEKSIAAWWNSR
jgi:PAS domain S-box-containing protein